MDIEDLNRTAWDKAVEKGDNPYTQVVSRQQVVDARSGCWTIQLSEQRTVPREWFPPLAGLRVLCLAGGGGQQAPILAAAGAQVTLLDGSSRQLSQDAFVAERDGLEMRLVQGDMADLSAFGEASFDLVVNPVSTLFVPDVGRVWRECRRVLVSRGVLMTGFMNPDEFVFDPDALDERGEFVVKYPLPYVEHETLDVAALQARIAAKDMFHFSHTMEAQLGGIDQRRFRAHRVLRRPPDRRRRQPDPVLHAQSVYRAGDRHRPVVTTTASRPPGETLHFVDETDEVDGLPGVIVAFVLPRARMHVGNSHGAEAPPVRHVVWPFDGLRRLRRPHARIRPTPDRPVAATTTWH